MISFEDMIKQGHENVETIEASDAIKLTEDPSITLIDIRDVRELQREGVIPGSYHCPRGMLEFWIHPGSPYHKDIFSEPEQKFVLYCGSGWRSSLSVQAIQRFELANVALSSYNIGVVVI